MQFVWAITQEHGDLWTKCADCGWRMGESGNPIVQPWIHQASKLCKEVLQVFFIVLSVPHQTSKLFFILRSISFLLS